MTAVGVAGAVGWGLRRLVDVVLALTVLAFLLLAVGPHVLGYRTLTMLSASMAPGIEPGDVVLVTRLDAAEVEPGMVLSYQIPVDDHRVVSHRVVSVQRGPDGSVTIQTRGDANDGPDPWTATLQGDTAWQVRGTVPLLGDAVRLLRDPVLSPALVWGAPALLAGWLLLSLWRPARPDADVGVSV